jgi:hypothetical protein
MRLSDKVQLSFWRLNNPWILTGIGLMGVLLRVLFVQDMEYKEDEEYHFNQSQWIGTTTPWPWVGIPSGVYLVNPGMSVWVFATLAKISGAHSPTELATALQIFSILGMSLVFGVIFFCLRPSFWCFINESSGHKGFFRSSLSSRSWAGGRESQNSAPGFGDLSEHSLDKFI